MPRSLEGLISQLLPVCVTRQSALAELRWMTESLLSARQRRNRFDYSENLIHVSNLHEAVGSLNLRESLKLNRWIHDRSVRHKPLQYILGNVPFCDLSILVRPPTLIPRWETESWTMDLIEKISENAQNHNIKELSILELCSGSGCIGIALAHHLSRIPSVRVKIHALDISQPAWVLSRLNQRKLGISKDSLTFHHGNLFKDSDLGYVLETHGDKFDMIVSNPPYVSDSEMKTLSRDVKEWEDSRALFAEEEGTRFYQRILLKSPDLIKGHGNLPRIIFEIGGNDQKTLLEKYLKEQTNYKDFQFQKDLAGHTRTLTIS